VPRHLVAFGRLAIVAAFLLLLVAPMIEMSTGLVPIEPLNENRDLAAAPQWRDLMRPIAFTSALQLWFRDNYGFRDLLIQLKTQMDYSLFNSSDRLHIGRDGWLFYRTVIDHEEAVVEAMSDAELDATTANFGRLRDWLGSRGIHLIVITNQLKDKFYPEYLPMTAARALGRHRFDDFRARLHKLPGITYIDTTDTLMLLKRQRPIFHKTDFHWNDPAAFVIGGQLVDAVAAIEHRPLPFFHNVLQIRVTDFSGGQAQFMPLFYPPHEQDLTVQPTWPDPHRVLTGGPPPFEFTSHTPPGGDLLPPITVFGDSFFDGIIGSGALDYFQFIARARLYHAPIEEVLRAIPSGTKFFVVQFIETALPTFHAMQVPTQ
jgi:hypothetical protein